MAGFYLENFAILAFKQAEETEQSGFLNRSRNEGLIKEIQKEIRGR